MNFNGSPGLVGSQIWHNTGTDVLDPLLPSQQNTIGHPIGRWNRMGKLWKLGSHGHSGSVPDLDYHFRADVARLPCQLPVRSPKNWWEALSDQNRAIEQRILFAGSGILISLLSCLDFCYFCGDAYNVMHVYIRSDRMGVWAWHLTSTHLSNNNCQLSFTLYSLFYFSLIRDTKCNLGRISIHLPN
jgi:hypothetical protein